MPNTVAVATKHGKLRQIAPAFSKLSDWDLQLSEIDTDAFGTFSGEIERKSSARETVIEKAKAGARSLGLDFGIASEGTIGANPGLPFINSDLELMAFVWLSKDVAIVESYISADIVAHSQKVTQETDLDGLLKKLDLPFHATNVVVENSNGKEIIKGIRDRNEARKIIEAALTGNAIGVSVETDFRAMNSPSRQRNISECAKKLANRIDASCPGCKAFGWGRTAYEYGLPCLECGLVNLKIAKAEILGCYSCSYIEKVDAALQVIQPDRCDNCNP